MPYREDGHADYVLQKVRDYSSETVAELESMLQSYDKATQFLRDEGFMPDHPAESEIIGRAIEQYRQKQAIEESGQREEIPGIIRTLKRLVNKGAVTLALISASLAIGHVSGRGLQRASSMEGTSLSYPTLTCGAAQGNFKCGLEGKIFRWRKHGKKALETMYVADLVDVANSKLRHSGWDKNGQKAWQVTYSDGKLEEKLFGLSEYGNRQESTYVNGKREGKQYKWYDNGQKYAEENYVNGKEEGKQFRWHKNGQKYAEENYVNGKEEGKQFRWHKNGQKYAEENYVNGKIEGKKF
ncbi:toxin-antitoxin system YwqK family antitoxin, partial [Candidatus Woesearchaeota archaeon]|nr:toxin-antitoxin system YwqK family antitoxin [Candidatus Woesearchaeota archaeon]